MATRVKFALPEREIQNSGITFYRDVNNERHGALTIRQNVIDWRPANHEYVYRMTWDKFSKLVLNKKNAKRVLPKTTAVRARKKLKAVPPPE